MPRGRESGHSGPDSRGRNAGSGLGALGDHAMTTKKQREQAEAFDNIRDALAKCGPMGSATLLFIDDGGRPSSSGRTHYIEIHVLENQADGRPTDTLRELCDSLRPRTTYYLTINAAHALGYRLNKADQIIMGGYGYSRTLQLASHLAARAGHALYCDTIGGGMGSTRGWVKP